MRRLTADFILNYEGNLVPDHELWVEDDGTITSIVPEKTSSAEYFPGILCPGFINAHVHLELSGFRNRIQKGKGLHGFIDQLVREREKNISNTAYLIENADNLMWQNGIQGAGDICNTDLTIGIKQKSKLRYHSFIELFEFQPERIKDSFTKGKELLNDLTEASYSASLVPHAPYSVHPELFHLIATNSDSKSALWCIHNQESASENKLFQDGTGALHQLFEKMKISTSWLNQTGKSSLFTTVDFLPKKNNIMLVHNTYTSDADIELLKSKDHFNRTWFCLCTNANLFIENRLPAIDMFRRNKCRIIIGTDSLASNDELSILEELKTIQNHFPSISTEELLTWATSSGADYFCWNDLGRFVPGSNPGIINISVSSDMMISASSKAFRIY